MALEFRKLYASEIECRVQQVTEKGASLLLYKDARVDQRLLDEAVGPLNWQRKHTRDNANCIVEIWDDTKKQWIAKEDTGTESNTEAEKGLASDSFKRACFNWGIGRELYTAPFIWINSENMNITPAGTDPKGKPRFITYDKFDVANIGYDQEGNISFLVIRNRKTKKVVFQAGTAQETPKPAQQTPVPSESEMQNIAKEKIDTTKVAALTAAASNNGVPIDKILRLYKVSALTELTEKQFANINANWERIKTA